MADDQPNLKLTPRQFEKLKLPLSEFLKRVPGISASDFIGLGDTSEPKGKSPSNVGTLFCYSINELKTKLTPSQIDALQDALQAISPELTLPTDTPLLPKELMGAEDNETFFAELEKHITVTTFFPETKFDLAPGFKNNVAGTLGTEPARYGLLSHALQHPSMDDEMQGAFEDAARKYPKRAGDIDMFVEHGKQCKIIERAIGNFAYAMYLLTGQLNEDHDYEPLSGTPNRTEGLDGKFVNDLEDFTVRTIMPIFKRLHPINPMMWGEGQNETSEGHIRKLCKQIRKDIQESGRDILLYQDQMLKPKMS